jgi:hypothetical protein
MNQRAEQIDCGTDMSNIKKEELIAEKLTSIHWKNTNIKIKSRNLTYSL